jgi:hypothetical protein
MKEGDKLLVIITNHVRALLSHVLAQNEKWLTYNKYLKPLSKNSSFELLNKVFEAKILE